MKLFGADFSGARDPSRGIYYAEGFLQGDFLVINKIVPCDDRLDLLSAIHSSKAPWGLDFPFSLPEKIQSRLQIGSWSELLQEAVGSTRQEFIRKIAESDLPSCETRCKEPSVCCRAADASLQAFSPLKRNNPNMLSMTYAGLKLLSYLRELGNAVYPFDHYDESSSRLYEVYPSHIWSQVGLSRNRNLEPFMEKVKEKYNFKVEVGKRMPTTVESLDAADAAVACVTLGCVLSKYKLESDWGNKYPWINDDEWDFRFAEGIVLMV